LCLKGLDVLAFDIQLRMNSVCVECSFQHGTIG
jgi:hypothetical protein